MITLLVGVVLGVVGTVLLPVVVSKVVDLVAVVKAKVVSLVSSNDSEVK